MAALLVLLAAPSCSGDSENERTAFCAALRQAASPTGPVRSVDLDNADSVESAGRAIDDLVGEAPDEISDDTEEVADVYRQVIERLSTAPAAGREAVLTELQPLLDEVTAATARFNSYAEGACGLSLDTPVTAEATPTPTVSSTSGIEG